MNNPQTYIFHCNYLLLKKESVDYQGQISGQKYTAIDFFKYNFSLQINGGRNLKVKYFKIWTMKSKLSVRLDTAPLQASEEKMFFVIWVNRHFKVVLRLYIKWKLHQFYTLKVCSQVLESTVACVNIHIKPFVGPEGAAKILYIASSDVSRACIDW